MSKISNSDADKISKIIKEAGDFLLSFYNQDLNVLSCEGRDIKLEADQFLEKFIKKKLSQEFSHPILGEELGETSKFDDLTGFVVDPIDGTMNFSRKNPIFCISIGFLDKGVPDFGAIYNPVLKELYVGSETLGVSYNGKSVQLDKNLDISRAILGTGIPTHMNLEDQTEFVNYIVKIKKFKKVRMIGSAAQSIAWIVNNRVDAYMENCIMLWDICAGLALVKGAGGHYIMAENKSKKWAYNVRAAVNKDIVSQLT